MARDAQETLSAARLAATLPTVIGMLPAHWIIRVNAGFTRPLLPENTHPLMHAGYVHLKDEMRGRSDLQPRNYEELLRHASLVMHELFNIQDRKQDTLSEPSTTLLREICSALVVVARESEPETKAAYTEILDDFTARLHAVGVLSDIARKPPLAWGTRIRDGGHASHIER